MKTWLECVKEAAIAEGWTTGQDFINAQSENTLTVFSVAAYVYRNQSNSHKHDVMQAEGSDLSEGAAVGKEREAQGECGWCEPASGFYLGTTCPKCQRPFRQEKRA